MSDPIKKSLNKQCSLSYIEQSMKMISSPQQAPVTIYPGPKAGLQYLSKTDLEIADRLEKLRRSSTDIPSEEEMAERLAQLKGLPIDHYNKPSSNIYHPPDNRSQFEKSDDLLRQVMDEVTLEQKLPKYESEIEARLANLREGRKENFSAKAKDKSSDAQILKKSTDLQEMPSSSDLEAELVSLENDPEIFAAIGLACKDREKNKKSKEKSKHQKDKEKYSGSDSEFSLKQRPMSSEEAKKEEEEVNRLVEMYTEKARLKREKKKKKKLDGTKSSDSSSKSDLSSSESDILTSESEKLSDSE